MKDSDSIFCKVISQEISGLFCNINGAQGDCQNCHWDGVPKKLLVANDPPLRNFFEPPLIKRLNQAGVVELSQIMALGEEGVVGRFGRPTVSKIKRQLKLAGIDLPKIKSANVTFLPKRDLLPAPETPLMDLLPARQSRPLKGLKITTLGGLLSIWPTLHKHIDGGAVGRIKRYLEARYEIKLN